MLDMAFNETRVICSIHRASKPYLQLGKSGHLLYCYLLVNDTKCLGHGLQYNSDPYKYIYIYVPGSELPM